jgi:Icc-related predicted phosphoesterase
LPACIFVSDLHGDIDRFRKLIHIISTEQPDAVFLGGDLLPSGLATLTSLESEQVEFINDFLIPEFSELKNALGMHYPKVFIILGNDDGRFDEATLIKASRTGLWEYVHSRKCQMGEFAIYGYSFVPPTPFLLKDWEKYDVSRYVDPGCVSPEEGWRSIPVSDYEKKYSTIKDDLTRLVGNDDLAKAIFLFHSPPHDTNLDLADLIKVSIDNVPLDPHRGSIAIRRFIETYQPLLTLHGHIHESASLSGDWKDKIGQTQLLTAAHDGPELAIVYFDPDNPEKLQRKLI